MAGAVADISSNQQQSMAETEAALRRLYMFLCCIGVYVPHSKSKCSWIHWAYCMAVTLCAWYLLVRMIPILWYDQYNAMDKVWYMGTYATIAIIITWIFVKNKRNKQLMNASIMVIKSLSEKSCRKFTKWCKWCFVMVLVLIIFNIVLAMLCIIFGWYSEELILFMLLPFKAGDLNIISEYAYMIYIIVAYNFITIIYVTHTLMLISFTKISQFAYESNLEQMKRASSHLPGLSDLSAAKIPDKQNSLVLSENSDRHINSADNRNAIAPHPQPKNNPSGSQLLDENKQYTQLKDFKTDEVLGNQSTSVDQLQDLHSPSDVTANAHSEAQEVDDQCGMPEEGAVTISTEDAAELPDEQTGRMTQEDLEACRTYYESISEYVATIDAFYHFPTGLSLFLGTFVACISLYYTVNATTEEDIDFLVYILSLSAFLLVICLYCGVATDKAVSLISLRYISSHSCTYCTTFCIVRHSASVKS